MEDIIIFGAGRNAIKQRDWAALAGYRVLFFVDNNPDKWGKTIDYLLIYSPEILRKYNCTIVFQDLYAEEIKAQLERMSYQGRKLGLEQLKKEAVCNKNIDIELPKVKFRKDVSFVFDSYFAGLNWGGVESWSCIVSGRLFDLGVSTCLICGLNSRFDKYAKNCQHFSDENEVMMVKKMAAVIAEFLPCIFISHVSIALYAAQIIKSVFPDQIQLVVVAHGDENNTYETIKFWSDQIDKIVCISKKIQNEFQMRYGIEKDVLLYRPNPVYIPMSFEERVVHTGTLKVGFAARLRKKQKRAHLLLEIIESCIQKKLDVEFNIAGEGECLELFQTFVSNKQLKDRVHILGWVEPIKMADFWSRQDIYLNISDFEGMSLAMLEAMVYGAVPVVTNVSGVNDLIKDGKNGFIIPIDNWMKAVDKIETLSKNREWMQKVSDYNKKQIKEKYNVCDYAKWVIETFHF